MKSKKAAMTAERAQFMHLFLAETDLRKGKREEGTLGIMQKKGSLSASHVLIH